MGRPDTFVQPQGWVPLAPLTTLQVGGPAQWLTRASCLEDVLAARQWAGERDLPLVILGGGSNLVVADRGVDGLVLHMDLRGCEMHVEQGELVVEVAAGEPWDHVVGRTVEAGFSGLECLSGIPGRAGGTPVQNVGAYGQAVSRVIEWVEVVDRATGRVEHLPCDACGFGYRRSRFKLSDRQRFIVTRVAFRLGAGPPETSYPEVARWLDAAARRAPSVADVREAVLAVRRRKGMVLDSADADTRSVGSFFVNPIVSVAAYGSIVARAKQSSGQPPGFSSEDGAIKIPAAWLIEHAGLPKGHGAGPAQLSAKHPLAIVNAGGATAREIIDFAASVKRHVIDAWGVWLQAEPVFLGCDGDEEAAFLRKAGG